MNQFKSLSPQTLLCIAIIAAISLTLSQSFTTPAACTSSTLFYNYFSHECENCPNGTAKSSADPTYCNCSSAYYPNPDSIGFRHSTSCLALNDVLNNSQVALIYTRSGARRVPLVTSCSINAYPNAQKTKCIPCGYSMIYSSSLGMCICSNNDFYPIGSFCVDGSSIGNPYTIASLQNRVLWGIANLGCITVNPSKQACQILLNKCAENNYRSTGEFCILLAARVSNGVMKNYAASQTDLNGQSLGIFASSVAGTDSASVKNKLNFVVLQYDKFGQLRDVKAFGTQLLPCLATQQDASQFQSFGLNLVKTCLVTDIQAKTSSYWDIYVLDSESKYVEVMTVYETGTTYYKRYYKNDYNSIQMTYRSVPPLSVPFITLSQKGTADITTSSKTDVINLVLTGPFIAFNVVSFLLFLISFYKYMKYNPYNEQDPYIFFKVIFIFLLRALRHWGVTLWIWLFGVSAYCFCFYKFQQTVYLLLPDTLTQWLTYYQPFMIVFYLQFAFVFFSVVLLIYDLGSATDYFIVDWEKPKDLSDEDIKQVKNRRPISVWRRILLVNELYQLTVTQLLDLYLIVVFGIFFLEGLKWINLSYQIPNINNLEKDFSSSSKKNIVLAYFIITFIFFIVGIVQYILRHIFKTWYPLPYENYIDLCCISNNSVIIFDHELHGYYIHGMNPLGQAEGSLKYLQSVFQKQAKSFGKSRAFKNSDPDQTQVFQVIYPKIIREAFTIGYKNRCMEKLISKSADTSILANPIPQNLHEGDYKQLQGIESGMVETFKYYLEGVKTSQFNIRQQSFVQRVLSCPIDSEMIGRLPIFFKDFWHKFSEVLLSGHEILLLINVINFINIFYIATNSVVIACFISLVICRLVIKNLADFFIKRNISRNTLIDDRFFS